MTPRLQPKPSRQPGNFEPKAFPQVQRYRDRKACLAPRSNLENCKTTAYTDMRKSNGEINLPGPFPSVGNSGCWPFTSPMPPSPGPWTSRSSAIIANQDPAWDWRSFEPPRKEGTSTEHSSARRTKSTPSNPPDLAEIQSQRGGKLPSMYHGLERRRVSDGSILPL